jgi:predicted small metal-binding protein
MSKKDQQQIEIEPLGEIRIKESKGFLKQIQRETTEIITKIRSHAEKNENIRRIQEDKMKGVRANKIQTEVITSHKKNVEIDWTW